MEGVTGGGRAQEVDHRRANRRGAAGSTSKSRDGPFFFFFGWIDEDGIDYLPGRGRMRI